MIHGDYKNGDHAGTALRQIIQVGTSAGCARAKATIAWNPQSEEVRSGQFEIPPGFDAWLLKFDGIRSDEQLGEGRNYGRIEYAYSLMAKEAGITEQDFREVADRYELLGLCKDIVMDVRAAVTQWPTFAVSWGAGGDH
uniref:hypothetical protein n=1 Tax=Cupriavidus yeoncheonensis TaxID=1462994 RepID=UPI003F49A461